MAPGLSAPERVLALQRTAGNRAVGRLLAGGSAPARRLARLDQRIPYIGALQSYLNPLNQATRLGVGRALTVPETDLLDGVFGNALATSIIRIRENATIIAGAGCYRTTGNIINIPATSIPDHDLIHEAAHVWQHQNSIPFAYAASALSAMAWAQLTQGDWEKPTTTPARSRAARRGASGTPSSRPTGSRTTADFPRVGGGVGSGAPRRADIYRPPARSGVVRSRGRRSRRGLEPPSRSGSPL